MLNRPFAFALSLAFLGFILFFSPAMAEGVKDKITLAYGVVEGFIEADGSGPGAELKNEVVARLEQRGYEVKTPLWPFKRVLVAFQHGKVDLAFPIVSDGGYAKSGFAKWGFKKIPLYSAPVYNGGKFVIYTAKDQPKLNRVNEIGQKLVGVFAGAFIPSELVSPTTYRTIEVKPGEQAFEMLRRGRMDAFLVQDYWGSSILD